MRIKNYNKGHKFDVIYRNYKTTLIKQGLNPSGQLTYQPDGAQKQKLT